MVTLSEINKTTDLIAAGWKTVPIAGHPPIIDAVALMQKGNQFAWIMADGTVRDATPDEVAKSGG